MSTRRTKIFINDTAVALENTTFEEGTISGYMTTTIIDEDDPSVRVDTKHFINTTQPATEALGYFVNSYTARYNDLKAYYNANFENVKVKRGNIIKKINNQMGKKVTACWIAAYDNDVLMFEIHYASGSIFQTTDIHMGVNHLHQRETTNGDCIRLATPNLVAMSTPVVPTARRKGCKLTLADETIILELMIAKKKNKHIAERFSVSPQYIGKMKKQFQADGKL